MIFASREQFKEGDFAARSRASAPQAMPIAIRKRHGRSLDRCAGQHAMRIWPIVASSPLVADTHYASLKSTIGAWE
ncbi:hypothetical protein AC630_05730 [Bradyrhizobium sp. AS23.2]|nr:hypothetical protein AC630_05730 [Bradyrhizobium sp. AS23.2]